MAVSLKEFVQQLEDTGILAGDTLNDFIPNASLLRDAEELSLELVRQKKLTNFQAERICQGQAQTLVLGNYVLMEKIATGGMGQVFKALHRRMDRIVAVKLLSSDTYKDPASIARFEREVKAIARFSHPNIVAAHDADCVNDLHFLVMEFVEGSDLSALVKKNGPLSLGYGLNVILQGARGLEAAHAAGIIHRDIKPSNLLLDKNGVVKILDLGISRLSEQSDDSYHVDLTSSGMVLGTPTYMPPEQALDCKSADARSDIYALGCSLFYLLTGKSVYDGNTLMQKFLAHRETPIPSLRTIRDDVPESIDSLFKKMVAKNVEDRYQTMTEVINELIACGHSSGLTLESSKPLEPLSPASFLTPRSGSATVDPSAAPTVTLYIDRTTKPQRTRKSAFRSRVGVGLLATLIAFTVLILNMKTENGTLILTVDQPNAIIQVLSVDETVANTIKSSSEPVMISINPGKHRLKINKEGYEPFSQEIEFESGKKQQLSAILIPLTSKQATAPTNADTDLEVNRSLAFETPEFSDWLKEVAVLPAEKQIEAVSQKLKQLNPGFDGILTDSSGKESPKVVNGFVTDVGFAPDNVTDISPLRAFPKLHTLFCFSLNGRGMLSDLSPLKGMSLISLKISGTKVSDLSPLQGMKLVSLSCFSTRISNLSPLSGMRLRRLNCGDTPVSTLSPLQAMPMVELICFNTYVADVSPLRGMRLTSLNVSGTDISDLSPLKGMSLDTLRCDRTDVSDLSPLREMELKTLIFTPKKIITGMNDLRQMRPLQSIGINNDTTLIAVEFWQKYDAGQFGNPPPPKTNSYQSDTEFPQWLKVVMNVSAQEQVEAVSRKLIELNPGFDGTLTNFDGSGTPKIVNGVVTELGFVIDKVTDISPVKALTELRHLNLHASMGSEGVLTDLSPVQGMRLLRFLIQCQNVRDLSPLEGMPLNELNCQNCPIKDLSPLRGMPLNRLILSDTKVMDLTPLSGMSLHDLFLTRSRVRDVSVLKGMPLENLKLDSTKITDLSPLSELPLTTLDLRGTYVSDLSPLRGGEITEISFSANEITNGIQAIRQMRSLESLRDDTGKKLAPTEFWKEYDAHNPMRR